MTVKCRITQVLNYFTEEETPEDKPTGMNSKVYQIGIRAVTFRDGWFQEMTETLARIEAQGRTVMAEASPSQTRSVGNQE
ncbi:hypothetical protein H5410_037775 [Solanum commersonii]|uniref:Uncharacterized protein n=1 Tax=Solanum commersonii TaxID=4109 RepID=A0A9J5Y9F4_SOLCO|nr:hypothetical protein H5410_037775 [Solanum commersonii]